MKAQDYWTLCTIIFQSGSVGYCAGFHLLSRDFIKFWGLMVWGLPGTSEASVMLFGTFKLSILGLRELKAVGFE